MDGSVNECSHKWVVSDERASKAFCQNCNLVFDRAEQKYYRQSGDVLTEVEGGVAGGVMDGSIAARLVMEKGAVNSEAIVQMASDVAALAVYLATHTAQIDDRTWLFAIAERWSKDG